MPKYFIATDEHAVETVDWVEVEGQGKRVAPGFIRAHVTVYEPADYAHPSLPTLRDVLGNRTDPTTGLLTYRALGPEALEMDPAPLKQLPEEYLNYRVSLGAIFVARQAAQ